MRIEFRPATGCPYGQFVVTAESEGDRAIISNFFQADREGWEFGLHGYGGPADGFPWPANFNFGWKRKEKKPFGASWKGIVQSLMRKGP